MWDFKDKKQRFQFYAFLDRWALRASAISLGFDAVISYIVANAYAFKPITYTGNIISFNLSINAITLNRVVETGLAFITYPTLGIFGFILVMKMGEWSLERIMKDKPKRKG